jgi:hypothetical protein
LSTQAIALDMASIIYSARELRDGHLSTNDVQAIGALIHLRRWVQAVAELVMARRWVETTAGWDIHDYLEFQPSREKVLAERAAAADRMRSVRTKSGGTSPERSPELRPKFNDPGPGPGLTLAVSAAAAAAETPGLSSAGGPGESRSDPGARAREEALPNEVVERLKRAPIGAFQQRQQHAEISSRDDGA